MLLRPLHASWAAVQPPWVSKTWAAAQPAGLAALACQDALLLLSVGGPHHGGDDVVAGGAADRAGAQRLGGPRVKRGGEQGNLSHRAASPQPQGGPVERTASLQTAQARCRMTTSQPTSRKRMAAAITTAPAARACASPAPHPQRACASARPCKPCLPPALAGTAGAWCTSPTRQEQLPSHPAHRVDVGPGVCLLSPGADAAQAEGVVAAGEQAEAAVPGGRLAQHGLQAAHQGGRERNEREDVSRSPWVHPWVHQECLAGLSLL